MKLEGDPYGLRPTGSALSDEVGLSPSPSPEVGGALIQDNCVYFEKN